jgi:hypothetical protein
VKLTQCLATIAKLVEPFSYLHGRWQDEKEYENFADYIVAAKERCEDLGFKFVSLTKRPFALTFVADDGDTREMRRKGNNIIWFNLGKKA